MFMVSGGGLAKEVLEKNSWASIGDISRGGSDLTTGVKNKKKYDKIPKETNTHVTRT